MSAEVLMKNGLRSTFPYYTSVNPRPTRLIYIHSVALNKEFNIKRHYVTKHLKFSGVQRPNEKKHN